MTDAFGRAPPREEPGAKMSCRSSSVSSSRRTRSVIWRSRPSSIKAGTPARIGAWKTSSPTRRKRSAPSRVCDAEQIIALYKSANGTTFAFGETALGALHEATTPSIWRRVTDGAEGRQSGGRRKEPRVNASAGSSEKRSGSLSHAPSYSKRMVSVPRTRLHLASPSGRVRPFRSIREVLATHRKCSQTLIGPLAAWPLCWWRQDLGQLALSSASM
jgi:hypothetical protein